MNNNYKHSELTEQIINAFYHVYNTLGYGFLEKVYENAMSIELEKRALSVELQKAITVYYDDKKVGQYFADMFINKTIIVELKASESLKKEHEYQLINYLKATESEIGLLLNFGTTPQVKRRVFSNSKKRIRRTEGSNHN
ncbi:MAG: GxxExxY protein [Fluviicola sp.]|nr:GxxExxY protein [Fluviicola sp.]